MVKNQERRRAQLAGRCYALKAGANARISCGYAAQHKPAPPCMEVAQPSSFLNAQTIDTISQSTPLAVSKAALDKDEKNIGILFAMLWITHLD
jgi:hypothetical protein